MAQIMDLRNFRRVGGHSMVARIGDELVEVFNISVAGIKVARPSDWQAHRNLDFQIIPQSGAVLEPRHAVAVHGHVVGEGPDHLRIVFSAVTHALAHVIGSHAAEDGPRDAQWAG